MPLLRPAAVPCMRKEMRLAASLPEGSSRREPSHKTNITCYAHGKSPGVLTRPVAVRPKLKFSRKTELPEPGIRILKRAYRGEWRKLLDLLKQNLSRVTGLAHAWFGGPGESSPGKEHEFAARVFLRHPDTRIVGLSQKNTSPTLRKLQPAALGNRPEAGQKGSTL